MSFAGRFHYERDFDEAGGVRLVWRGGMRMKECCSYLYSTRKVLHVLQIHETSSHLRASAVLTSQTGVMTGFWGRDKVRR